MKQLINVFKKMFTSSFDLKKIFKHKSVVNPLGRWNVDNSEETINLKVDLANEDNCGPCGMYMYGTKLIK